MSGSFPPFRPHPLLRGGHAQTLAGVYLPGHRHDYRARQHRVDLADGDQLVLHDDCPEAWRPDARMALLIHGLAGCHESGYMRRIAHKLNAHGVRVFRMDLRGCGAGQAFARLPYHSGRSEDARAAVEFLAALAPEAPLTLVGFSLGGNITLKLLGELGGDACGRLDSAMAVCPPADLAACSRQISRRRNRPYDRYFVRLLIEQITQRARVLPDAARVRFARTPRTIWEFDNEFTAPVCGFGTADRYYAAASSAPLVSRIRVPTRILAAADDPMIPPDIWERLKLPESVHLHVSRHGGHLGFVGRGGMDPDRRWMDWRVVDRVLAAGGCAAENARAELAER